MKNYFLLGASFLSLLSCHGRETAASAKLMQIGSMGSPSLYSNWTCKMIAYDWDKYYPISDQTLDSLAAKGCIAPPAPKEDTAFGGNFPTLMDIDFVHLPDKKIFLTAMSECNANIMGFEQDLNNHLANLQTEWKAKKCTREMAKKETSIIVDEEACISPCDLLNPNILFCSTCSPSGKEKASKYRFGTITCGSEKDARSAVQDYCKRNALGDCVVECKDVQVRSQAGGSLSEFTSGDVAPGLAGGTSVQNYDVTNAKTFTAYFNHSSQLKPGVGGSILGGLLSGETGIDPAITGKVSSSVTLRTTTSINISSPYPTVFVKNFGTLDAKGQPRIEANAKVNYICSLNKVKVTDVDRVADFSIGQYFIGSASPGSIPSLIINKIPGIGSVGSAIAGNVSGGPKATLISRTGVGATIDIKHEDAHSDIFMSPIFKGAGRTLEEIKNSCADWTNETIVANAVVGKGKIKPLLFKIYDIKCTYKNKPNATSALYNMKIVENFDKSGEISYRDRVMNIFGSKAKSYVLSPKDLETIALELGKLKTQGNALPVKEKNTIILKLMNEVVKPKSQTNAKWALEGCELL